MTIEEYQNLQIEQLFLRLSKSKFRSRFHLSEKDKKYVEEKGCKNGYAMWPIRTAVSGKQSTPGGATEIMEIIGKEETIARLKAAIEKLSN